MIILLFIIAAILVCFQVFGKMFIEIAGDIDKKNREEQKEKNSRDICRKALEKARGETNSEAYILKENIAELC